MKMRQDNEMTNRICMVYIENGTKLPWIIRQSLVYEKMRQDNDIIDRISAVYVENKTKFS